MKTCAACHEDLPKEKFSKKQWKLNQRRCKVCVSDNREVQQLPPTAYNEPDDKELDYNEIIRLLDSIVINDADLSPVSDEELFKQPPQKEDCLICFLQMPSMWNGGHKYKSCCGKVICSGCIHANRLMMKGNTLCPFCRTPNLTSNEDRNERYYARIAAGDAEAVFNYGVFYASGKHGYPKDCAKALELYARAGKLGCAIGYHNIGNAYLHGNGVQRDKKKAKYYWELAAMGGDGMARHNLGLYEKKHGNMDRALKHFMISARVGHGKSLKEIKQLYTDEFATKDDYSKALRSYQECLDEIRSDQRDKAAAFDNVYKYY